MKSHEFYQKFANLPLGKRKEWKNWQEEFYDRFVDIVSLKKGKKSLFINRDLAGDVFSFIEKQRKEIIKEIEEALPEIENADVYRADVYRAYDEGQKRMLEEIKQAIKKVGEK